MRCKMIKATFEVPLPQGADENGNAFTLESIETALPTIINCPITQECVVDVRNIPQDKVIGHITDACMDAEAGVIKLKALYYFGGFGEIVGKMNKDGAFDIERFSEFCLCK